MKPELFLLRVVAIFCTSLTFALKAQAGGDIEQPTLEAMPEKPFLSSVTTPQLKIWGNWEIWGQPYWLNGNICREKAANLICLTSQQAKNHRWSISSNNGK